MARPVISGFVDERFARVRELFEKNLTSGADVGASFCVTVGGETVVDLWGGFADEAGTRPWTENTIVNVWSTTKTMTALTALLIADRGELDFDAPVAKYWPEFAQNGKAKIKVSHLMSHSAGLSGWKEPLQPNDLYDWDKMCALLAAQAPFWEPGTASGYHGLTQGYLVGEVVRRITGKTVSTVFREEISEPLGIDFYMGLPASEDHRVADLIPPTPEAVAAAPQPTPIMLQMLSNPMVDPMQACTREWRAAGLLAAGGHGNARSIAQAHVILANGGLAKGKRFMSEAGCRKALEPQIEGVDLVLNLHAKFGLGFGLPSGLLQAPEGNLFWAGYGGSLAIIDTKARASFGYAMNKMNVTTVGDARGLGMIEAAREAIGRSR